MTQSLADAMYPGGPISDGPSDARARALIDSGIAKPAEPDVPTSLPPRNDPPRNDPPRNAPPTAPQRLWGQPDPTFDATRYAAPEGQSVDPALMGEFGSAAKELGLNQTGGERLLALHQKATTAATEAYANRLAAGAEDLVKTLNPDHVEVVKELLADERLTPPEMRQWVEQWGNHPGLARMLTAWAGAIRNGRRGY
jgi:hypothetical protein